MVEESELISLLITWGIVFFLLATRKVIRSLPSYQFLCISFGFFLLSRTCTVLEGFFWETVLNALEHICAFLGCAVFFWWCLQVGLRKEAGQ